MFATTGGSGPIASRVMKRSACKISAQRDESHADAIAYQNQS